jgi:membrane associated rhomboid family serine protease
MIEYGAQFRPLVLNGEAWRLVTAMFVHAGTSHILFNMLFFVLAARWVEPFYGRLRFLLLYMGAGLMGNVMTLLLTNLPTAGASGAVLGVLAALIVIGFKHSVIIPDYHQWKFGWLPLGLSGWILYSGFHNPQTNNIAHVVGFCTGLALAAAFAPLHALAENLSYRVVRVASWAMGLLCAYTLLGVTWSVYRGLDESGDIEYARHKFSQGRLAVRLALFKDPRRRYELRVPVGWERMDQREADGQAHFWISPMGEANVSIITYDVPPGQGGDEAFALEQTLINARAKTGELRTLSRQKRLLSGRVGGRIVMEGIDDRGNARHLFYYFVPVKDKFYILVGSVERFHVPKYEPVFDTIAASFRA